MPSVSKKQHNLMAAVAKNPAFAKKAGIPQRVGADFLKADKGRKFAKGGDMAKKLPPFMGKESKAEEAKEMNIKRMSPALYKKGEKAEGVHGKSGKEKPSKYADGGMPVGMAGPQAMTPSRPNMPPAPAPYPQTGSGAVVTATRAKPRVPLNMSDPSTWPAAPAPAPAPQVGLPGKSINAGPISGKPGMGQSTTSGARPTNPFTQPALYKAQQSKAGFGPAYNKIPGQGVAQANATPSYKSSKSDLMGKQMSMKKGGTAKTAAKGSRMKSSFADGGMPLIPTMQTMPSSVGRPVGMAGPQAMTPAQRPLKPFMGSSSGFKPPASSPTTANAHFNNFMTKRLQDKQLSSATPPAPYMNNYGNPGGPVMKSGPQTTLPVSTAGVAQASSAPGNQNLPTRPAPRQFSSVQEQNRIGAMERAARGQTGFEGPNYQQRMNDLENAMNRYQQMSGMASPGATAEQLRAMEQFKKAQQTAQVGIAGQGGRTPAQLDAENKRLSAMTYDQRVAESARHGRSYEGRPPEGYKDPNAIMPTEEQFRSQLPGFVPGGAPVMGPALDPRSAAMPMPEQRYNPLDLPTQGIKKGGVAKTFAKGGSIDGCATKGKTKAQSFAKGGMIDGCAQRGKTKCKIY